MAAADAGPGWVWAAAHYARVSGDHAGNGPSQREPGGRRAAEEKNHRIHAWRGESSEPQETRRVRLRVLQPDSAIQFGDHCEARSSGEPIGTHLSRVRHRRWASDTSFGPLLTANLCSRPRVSEFDVGAEGRDDHGAAVAVVSRVVDVLEPGSEVDPAPDVQRVVGLDDVFPAVVEASVTEKEAQTPGREIVLMILLDGVGNEGDAGAVLFAMPPRAVGADAQRDRLIVFGVGEGFGLSVVPSDAGESREVRREILLQVEAESVLQRDVPGMVGDVRRYACGGGLDDLVAINAHVGKG